MLDQAAAQYREALKLADAAHQALIVLTSDSQTKRDNKIHAEVDGALEAAGLEMYDAELHMDAPRYDDSLDEIPGARCEFRLCIRGIEDGDYAKIARALKKIGLKDPLDHAKPDAIEYEVNLR